MYKFDTKVQYLKYKVLKEVAKHAWEDDLYDTYMDIPDEIITDNKPSMRCCIHKEKAILAQRVKLAMGAGKNKKNHNVINVIDIACDDCPSGGFEVTNACRGCLAHRCQEACRKDAIVLDSNMHAHIDKTKCIECGMCSKACPYSAIINLKRPCQLSCKVKAISMREDKASQINDEKCISCGACVYACPFGAITDRSFIVDVIDLIKQSQNNTKYKVVAAVAPSIAGQFSYAKLPQIVTAIKEIGFAQVVEVALGADMVAKEEAQELMEKGFLTSSCCPAFVKYVQTQFPALKDKVSHNLSPMGRLGKHIKEIDPNVKVVFIGPCTAKKMEIQKEEVSKYIDSVLTFEELQALMDSKNIDASILGETELDNASYYGRIFARSGGVTDAITQAVKESGKDFAFNPCVCDGIEACKVALLKASKGILPNNFIEGMACVSGCIGGAGCLTHGEKNKANVDIYGKEAGSKTIEEAVSNSKDLIR